MQSCRSPADPPKNWNGCSSSFWMIPLIANELWIFVPSAISPTLNCFLINWLVWVYIMGCICGTCLHWTLNQGCGWASHVALSRWFLSQHVVWDVYGNWFLISGLVIYTINCVNHASCDPPACIFFRWENLTPNSHGMYSCLQACYPVDHVTPKLALLRRL